MAVTLIGKIIITIALCSQAYLMAMDTTAINEFTSNAKKVIPKSLGIENIVGYLHFVVAGLLATSILMTVFKNCFFKVTVLLALVALLVIENSTLLTTLPSIKEEYFWQRVAMIGAIVYLMGADCSSKKGTHYSKTE